MSFDGGCCADREWLESSCLGLRGLRGQRRLRPVQQREELVRGLLPVECRLVQSVPGARALGLR
jgi:hypothetical protein